MTAPSPLCRAVLASYGRRMLAVVIAQQARRAAPDRIALRAPDGAGQSQAPPVPVPRSRHLLTAVQTTTNLAPVPFTEV